tara:strand:+ start:201 stop:980 length:780 start_codon:yes stop_codon:yes gene_type:complete
MSILNVNKINPVGSGSTITIAGIASVTGNISVGGSITGEHHGDASNLTSIPAGNLTGTVADARISTLTASKLTGALPAISAANCTNIPAANITGTLPAISGANLTGLSAGVTMANSWNCSSGFNYQAQTDITAWSEDTAGKVGTGMSQSSGIFTFPSTGIYRVRFSQSSYNIGAAEVRYIGAFIKLSTNSGGSYSILREQYDHINNDNSCTTTVVTSNYLDITNTSTTRIKFTVAAELSSTLNGGSYGTYVEFLKLGET